MRPFGKYDVPQSEVLTRRLGTPALEASYNPGVLNLFWHEIYFYICQPLEVYQFGGAQY